MTIIRESLKKYFLNEVAKIYYLFLMWRHVCVYAYVTPVALLMFLQWQQK